MDSAKPLLSGQMSQEEDAMNDHGNVSGGATGKAKESQVSETERLSLGLSEDAANTDPGVMSSVQSPSEDAQTTQPEKLPPVSENVKNANVIISKAKSVDLPRIICDSNDQLSLHSMHSERSRSNFKQMHGQRSLDLGNHRMDSKNYLSPNGSRAASEGRQPQECVISGDNISRSSSSSYLRHHIMMEEVAPSASSIVPEGNEWKVPLQSFSSKKHGKGDKALPRRIRRYYKTQDQLISTFEDLRLDVDDAMQNAEQQQKLLRMTNILSKVTFVCNLLLLISKAVAAGLSGSLSVISAVIDSAVDLISGALMWWSSRAIKNRDLYQYPQGRTKLEPIAIVIVSVVMALASVQMIRESVEQIIHFAQDGAVGPTFDTASIVLCVLTVVTKLVLFLVCRRVKSPSTQALAQDHRNDVISNTGAILCGYIGYKFWAYMDPLGAICISLYIIVSWFLTGWEQIKMLTGHTARPDFLKKITWIALNHHPEVLLIDTVRAFHFGSNFLVEVDIVLPEEMNLKHAHDIGESLQLKIERLSEVERAFVHLDYECEHSPFSEHKQV